MITVGLLGDIVSGFVRTVVAAILVFFGIAVVFGGTMWSATNNSVIGWIITFFVGLGLIGAGITVGRGR